VLSSASDGQVTVSMGNQTSSIQFTGADETVNDQLSAATRSFIVDPTISQVQLSADSQTAGMSQLTIAGGTVVDFQNPDQALTVTTDASASTTIDVHGLDAGFNASLTVTAGAGTTVEFSAPTNLGTGSLNVTAGDIEIDDPVMSTAGTIELN